MSLSGKNNAVWITFIILLFAVVPAAADIIHTKLDAIELNKPLVFRVELQNLTENATVRVFYRAGTRLLYDDVQLQSMGPNVFGATLTTPLDGESNFQYYIVVSKDNRDIATLPEYNPKEYPFTVPVVQDKTAPSMQLLMPEPGEKIRNGFPTILVSFEDDFEQLDPATFQLFLNEEDLTKKTQISSRFASYIPERELEEGKYAIKAQIKDIKGKMLEKSATFVFLRKEPELYKVKGTSKWDTRTYQTDKQSTSITREPLETQFSTLVNLDANWFLSNLDIRLDNRESPHKQPFNRISLETYDVKRNVLLMAGDTTPVISELALSGRLVQGVDLGVDLFGFLGIKKFLTMRAITGQTQRAIPSPNVTAGTYKQTLVGANANLNLFGIENGLSYIKIYDDQASLTDAQAGSTKPKENHVISVTNKMRLFDLTEISLETAGSVFYSDTTAAIVDVSTLNLPIKGALADRLLKIFPPRSSLSIGAASQLDVKTPVIWRNVLLKTGLKWAQPSYASLAQTGIKKDNFEFGADVTVRLFDNLLSITGGAAKQNNNVMTSDPLTAFTDDYRTSATLAIPSIAILNGSYGITNKWNKQFVPNDVTDNRRIQNRLTAINVGLGGIQLEVGKFVGKIDTNYSINNYSDPAQPDNTFDSNAVGVNLGTEWEPVKLKFSLSQSLKNDKGTTPNTTTFRSASGKAFYDITPKKFSIYAGYSITLGANNGPDIAKQIDNRKTAISVGGNYLFPDSDMLKNSQLSFNWDILRTQDAKAAGDKAKNFSENLISILFSSTF